MKSAYDICLKILILMLISSSFTNAKPYEYVPADRGENILARQMTTIFPDRFLREYDPITFFFSNEQSGIKIGPEDKPQKWVSMTPSHPGEYIWIDNKTLEFRPTIPWTPVTEFNVKVKNYSKTLSTLLSPPRSISPSHRSSDLGKIKEITLLFAYPVKQELLKKLISFESTPLPGIDRKKSIYYSPIDYQIKTGEQKPSGEVPYTFIFNKPFGLGNRIRTHVKLSNIAEFSEGKEIYYFDTKTDFKPVKAGTYGNLLSITSNGSQYSVDHALPVDKDGRVVVEFSSKPENLTLTHAKNLFTFSPAPQSFDFEQSGRRVIAKVKLLPERIYKVNVNPIAIKDNVGRKILMKKSSSFYIFRNPDKRYIRWGKSYSILERYGPQHIPLNLANINSIDLRIHKIDARNKVFWPFPEQPISVDERQRPPGPGEEPKLESKILNPLSTHKIKEHIQMLGSPHFSSVLDVEKEDLIKFQTLDLKKKLEKISGKDEAGTYLIGFRELSGTTNRHWIKVCVTDLVLSTVESKDEVLFVVTSYKTGKPVAGATIEIDGVVNSKFKTLYSQQTDREGKCILSGDALYKSGSYKSIKRVTVSKGDDILLVDTRSHKAPPRFADNHWQENRSGWLSWLSGRGYNFSNDIEWRGFLFTERPIYRPEEKVYFKGFARKLHQGILNTLPAGKLELTISGPDNTWKEEVELSEYGSFDYVLDEDELITGEYSASVQYYPANKKFSSKTLARTSFRVDAYRIPKFEVKLHGPDYVPNDRPFSMGLTASYYAGGKVIEGDAKFVVNAYPYTWKLKGWSDYLLSSDSRYSRSSSSTGQGSFEKQKKTDDNGSAKITIKPNAALGSSPLKYIIEGTVTDIDQQSVTDSRSIISLPSFVLALKTDRYIKGASSIDASLAAISSTTEKAIAGQKINVVLKKMSWNSYLQETDFARGEPRYITQENVTKIEERTITTTDSISKLTFENREPGVYIIELSSTDKLGRLQTLVVDLFLAGDKPVVWQKSQQKVFTTVTDKEYYEPGEKARIILKSPYQNAQALAVVEQPDGRPTYSWIKIVGGQADFELQITPDMVPKIPVSFLLMRPRISSETRLPEGGRIDLGKPETVANLTWLKIKPTANQLTVSLQHSKVNAPADTMMMTVKLTDWKGKPASGEVTLWLVDKAVLSLAKERSLDPVKPFIPNVSSHISMRDSRNLALGKLRDFESPGGDEMDEESMEESAPITVRKNFKTVPYYNANLKVGKSGSVQIPIPLPDNLTVFAIRAVAVSGLNKFGLKKSQVSVRLPVIVQPSLPRFVRVGDTLTAGGIARIVEGDGGAGSYSLEAKGLKVISPNEKWNNFTFPGKKAHPLYVKMVAVNPGYDDEGKLAKDSISFQMAVRKKGSKKGDAFRVSIPLKTDRDPVTNEYEGLLTKDSIFTFDKLDSEYRAKTLIRRLMVSNELALLKVLTGLRYLIEYPHGCAEQRVSRSYPSLVYQDIWKKLGVKPIDPKLDKYVNETVSYLEKVQDDNGLFAYWPGGTGGVYLTAYAMEFLTAVKKANKSAGKKYVFNNTVYKRALSALERAARSDYSRSLSSWRYFERCAAIQALVKAGKSDMGYLKQMAYHSQEVDALSQSRIYSAIIESGKPMGTILKDLEKSLWNHTVFKLKDGKEVFGGLQQGSSRIGAEMHSSQVTALAGIVGGLSRKSTDPKKVDQMAAELVTYGGRDGWGNTHANGIALLSIHDRLVEKLKVAKNKSLSLNLGAEKKKLTYEGNKGMLLKNLNSKSGGSLKIENVAATDSLYVKLFERFVPKEDGSKVNAKQEGFVIKRQIIIPGKNGAPSEKTWIDSAGVKFQFKNGDIVEEHIQVTNPENRHFVAVIIPLAAGFEYLNPELKIAAEDWSPEGATTNSGSYQFYGDDKIVFYFNNMSAGTFDFYFRTRATIAGSFTQPPAKIEMMYDEKVRGNSCGARIVISQEEK